MHTRSFLLDWHRENGDHGENGKVTWGLCFSALSLFCPPFCPPSLSYLAAFAAPSLPLAPAPLPLFSSGPGKATHALAHFPTLISSWSRAPPCTFPKEHPILLTFWRALSSPSERPYLDLISLFLSFSLFLLFRPKFRQSQDGFYQSSTILFRPFSRPALWFSCTLCFFSSLRPDALQSSCKRASVPTCLLFCGAFLLLAPNYTPVY